jgi:hypothetical protein
MHYRYSSCLFCRISSHRLVVVRHDKLGYAVVNESVDCSFSMVSIANKVTQTSRPVF